MKGKEAMGQPAKKVKAIVTKKMVEKYRNSVETSYCPMGITARDAVKKARRIRRASNFKFDWTVDGTCRMKLNGKTYLVKGCAKVGDYDACLKVGRVLTVTEMNNERRSCNRPRYSCKVHRKVG